MLALWSSIEGEFNPQLLETSGNNIVQQMDEFKDAEDQELPNEEYLQTTSSSEELPNDKHPQITSSLDSYTSTLDDKLPISSDMPIQSTEFSSLNINEPETAINNTTASSPNSQNVPSLQSLTLKQNELNSVVVENSTSPTPESSMEPNISLISSETTVENPTIISSENHASSNQDSRVEHPPQISSNANGVIAEDSDSLSSMIHESEVHGNNGYNASNDMKETKVSKAEKHKMEVHKTRTETKQPTKPAVVYKGIVDTSAPFESVKEAVSKFGGIVDWKAHRAQALERRRQVQLELEKVKAEIPNYKKQSEEAEEAKAQVLNELEATKRLIEELKLNLEKSQTEEAQAKQDSELAQLRAKEMEQGITNESSVAAKAQLELAKARHEAAIAELISVKNELDNVQKDYIILLKERDEAIKKAEESMLANKEIEKMVEDLTLELISIKESLESAHAAHLEAEEHRIGSSLARDQDYLFWEQELKQAQEELRNFQNQILSINELKEKLDASSKLLLDLNNELSAFMKSKLAQESETSSSELDELKVAIEKAKNEVTILKAAELSLKLQLEKEKAGLANMRQREGMASITLTSVEAEIDRTKEEIKTSLANEKKYHAKIIELPRLLQQAAQENEEAKDEVESAKDELRKAKEESEQAKATKSTIETRLIATSKEIEAAKASENLAVLAIKALKESEGEELSDGVSLPVEEYYALSKKVHEAEELSNELVTAAIVQIEVAKESELKTLEKLENAYKELNEKREALRIAMEKSERAQEGKLGAEQELRKRRASNAAKRGNSNIPPKSPARSFEESKSFVNENTVNPGPNAKVYMEHKESNVNEVKTRKKKKSFFPRIMMFLARKKQESL